MGESAKRRKNNLSEVGTFIGHESRLEIWYDLTLIGFETYYPEVKDIIEGHKKPVEVYTPGHLAGGQGRGGGRPWEICQAGKVD